jgi:hypothetical protein
MILPILLLLMLSLMVLVLHSMLLLPILLV